MRWECYPANEVSNETSTGADLEGHEARSGARCPQHIRCPHAQSLNSNLWTSFCAGLDCYGKIAGSEAALDVFAVYSNAGLRCAFPLEDGSFAVLDMRQPCHARCLAFAYLMAIASYLRRSAVSIEWGGIRKPLVFLQNGATA